MNPWIVAISVMFGTFMEVLDTTVVNVSLPHIAGSMSATTDEATWVLTSYLVANAIILPMTGWLASQFGRKRLLMLAVTGFTVASFFCGLAPNLASLIVFRCFQGAFGGALQPLSQAVLLEAFPPQDRGKAMGFWGLGIVVAPILGPVLGGYLTDSYNWRWVFYINIPVGIASIVMVRLFLFDPPYLRKKAATIDYWGMGLLTLAIASMQILLDKGEQDDWLSSLFIRTLLVIGVCGTIAFIVRELIADHPVVNLRVLKERTFTAGIILITVVGFVLYGSMVLLPLWLQTLLGYPAVEAGLTLAPRGIGSFIAMPVVGMLVSKLDPRKIIIAGLLTTSVTLFQFSRLSLAAGYWDFFWPQFFQGVAMGMVFVPLTTVTMSRIPKEQIGNATSINSLMRNIGASLGIASLTTYMSRQQQVHLNDLSVHVSPYNGIAQRMMTNMPGTHQQGMARMWGMVLRQAAILSYIDAFVLLAAIFAGLIPLILIMKKPPRGGGAPAGAAH
ncbi:MAG TPA: DHA2 family efflux MFS transporter permease subunit [Bryobacteraceae bacterium]|nr:DHA2 family efflux MFS transporter permease subunit [Bryobacteraceae bacterium]